MSKIFKVKVKDKEYEVEVEELKQSSKPAEKDNKKKEDKKTEEKKVEIPKVKRPKVESKTGEIRDDVIAPLPGVIVDILVKEGKKVKEGEKIVILEAMKMENALLAPISGKVENIHIKVGQEVMGDYPLLTIIG